MAKQDASIRKEPTPFELKPVEPRCTECGYDLRTLATASGARCPECGSRLPFDKLKFKRDRTAERPYRGPKHRNEWWNLALTRLEFASLVVPIIAICIAVSRLNVPTGIRNALFVATVVIGTFIGLWVLSRVRRWRSIRNATQRRSA